MKKIVFLLVLPLMALALVFAGVFSRSSSRAGRIRVSGNIEVTSVEISFRIPGVVLERAVDEGHALREGQLVARLDHRDLEQELARLSAEVQAARAALAELEAGSRAEEIAEAEAAWRRRQWQLDQLLAGSRPQEIAEAEAAVAAARADLDRWRLEYERQLRLFERGVISSKDFDVARATHDMTRARLRQEEQRLALAVEGPRMEEIEQARQGAAEARQRFELVKKGPRPEQIDQARARLQAATEARTAAETRLSYATLRSPIGGVVLSKNVEHGEYVSAGTPVVTAADLVHVWLRAYIDEADLARVKPGQRADVSVDSYPGRVYGGRVSFIADQAEFTPKTVQTEKQRVRLVYRIKIDIENPRMELKAGMPADAEIVTGEGK